MKGTSLLPIPPALPPEPGEPLERPSALERTRLPAFVREMLELLRAWVEVLLLLFGGKIAGKARRARSWHIRVGRKGRAVTLSAAELNDLLQRHRDLKDIEKLAQKAASFRTAESDFFADPHQIERLFRRLLEENPPWLYVSRVLSGNESGAESRSQEHLWREQVTREMQDVTLYIPDESWRDKPLSSLTLRQARRFSEVWQARLLDQVLPPEILIDRLNRGEILIPVRHGRQERLDFRPVQRRISVEVRKKVPIPIEMIGGDGRGGQLLYFLLDYSASMNGKSATLALAVIAAVLRANMGQRETRYLFRRYADIDNLWPRQVEPPLQATTLAEKDAFLEAIFATNFHGGATHVNDALQVAVSDIEALRREEYLDASILLVTDGRAEILNSARERLAEAKIKVHTVMVTPEANPGLEAISDSFTRLDIHPDQALAAPEPHRPLPQTPTRRAYRI